MKNANIALIDDDPGMLRALGRLLRMKAFTVHTFDCPKAFLGAHRSLPLDCAVLDLSMPGLNGLELQKQINGSNVILPIVFLSGAGDIPTSVRAIKAGAVNFLTKPVDEDELLSAIGLAVIEGAKARASALESAEIRTRFEKLSPRELEVLRHVISGKLNKQIASDLGISEQTVKVHRMRITGKSGLPSVAELVRAAERLGIEAAQ